VKDFELLRENLQRLGSFHLLLGLEPTGGLQIGVRPEEQAFCTPSVISFIAIGQAGFSL
jgi:hypothetical protein